MTTTTPRAAIWLFGKRVSKLYDDPQEAIRERNRRVRNGTLTPYTAVLDEFGERWGYATTWNKD